eukprot:26052_1
MLVLRIVVFIVMVVFGVYSDDLTSSECEINSDTLCVNQANSMGFGDPSNQYAFAMAEFKGSLYVATLNAVGGLPTMALFFLGLPFATNGVEIHKGDSRGNSNQFTWTRVVTGGNGDAENYGIRKLIVVGDYMYGVTANHYSGFELWRTNDGENWDVVKDQGFGDPDNTSGRGLTTFDGYIYVGSENRRSGGKMWRRAINENGDFVTDDDEDWEQIIDDGLGSTLNFWFADLVEFNGWLYAGTLNPTGMQLWRTNDGVEFENVFKDGNGVLANTAAMKLYVFNNKLYVGTMNFVQGASLYINTNDEGTEFDTIFIGGNGNSMNHYVWQMEEYNNRLYVGTFNSFEEFDLFSSNDPENVEFVNETDSAFGYDGQYGIRSMAVFEEKLMIGTATAKADKGCIVFSASSNEISENA